MVYHQKHMDLDMDYVTNILICLVIGQLQLLQIILGYWGNDNTIAKLLIGAKPFIIKKLEQQEPFCSKVTNILCIFLLHSNKQIGFDHFTHLYAVILIKKRTNHSVFTDCLYLQFKIFASNPTFVSILDHSFRGINRDINIKTCSNNICRTVFSKLGSVLSISCCRFILN